MRRSRRRVLSATAVAAVLGGSPSTAHELVVRRDVAATIAYQRDVTARIGVLVPLFRPGILRGVAAHAVISVLAGEAFGLMLPRRNSLAWGAAAGLVMGVVNVGVIGRRIPAIAELPLGPQLADNVAFGMIFAAVVDRGRTGE